MTTEEAASLSATLLQFIDEGLIVSPVNLQAQGAIAELPSNGSPSSAATVGDDE